METWMWVVLAIIGLAALLLFGWFVLKAIGYDGVVTQILLGWMKNAG